eukprot:1340137-Rhodomonas_salina.2
MGILTQMCSAALKADAEERRWGRAGVYSSFCLKDWSFVKWPMFSIGVVYRIRVARAQSSQLTTVEWPRPTLGVGPCCLSLRCSASTSPAATLPAA